jgi:Raf kinase inhibitor-like YbhB/YbcL family protein
MTFKLTSAAFADGGTIPKQFTCDGNDQPPPLTVSDPPDGTKSFALIMDDPDAPNGTFTHWLAYDIPFHKTDLRMESAKTLRNSFGRDGYGGPCPPHGHGPHRYYLTVHAVDVSSLPLKGQSRSDVDAALHAHTLATAQLVGRYERVKVGSAV